jgi:hypothetical protein
MERKPVLKGKKKIKNKNKNKKIKTYLVPAHTQVEHPQRGRRRRSTD